MKQSLKNSEFKTAFERKTAKNILENNLINEGDRILVALSGGKDSVAMFCFLLTLRDKLKFSLCAYHLNHKLRGKDADADAEFVKNLCEKHTVALISEEIDINEKRKEEKASFESFARSERYKGLENASEKLGCNLIATAHTKSDSAETLLINISRGCGLKGLSSIPVKRDNIIRPILTVTSEEVYEYLESIDMPFCTDKTNFSTEYTRNKVRLLAVPVLNEVNGAFLDNAERAMTAAGAAYKFINALARQIVKNARSEQGVYLTAPILEVTKKEEYDALLYEVFSVILTEEKGLSLSSERYVALRSALLSKKDAKIEISSVFSLIFSNNTVYTEKEEEEDYNIVLSDDQTVRLDAGIKISVKSRADKAIFKKINILNKIVSINTDNINGNLCVRKSDYKDEYKIRGMTKSVKKLLNEKKVLSPYRSSIPIICDATGPVYLCGFDVCDRVKAKSTDKNITLINTEFEHNIFGDRK